MTINDKLTSIGSSSNWQVDPRVKASEERMRTEHDPNVIEFDQVLTDSDKQMLSAINGGNWRQPGPAEHLVDQIATARHDGTLTGPITSDFIKNIIAKQQSEVQAHPSAQIPIPFSALAESLQWIKLNAQQTMERILG